jgi:hypothetical protein
MGDKDLKEMVRQLFDLTIEIEDKEKEIAAYEQDKRFAPIGLQLEVVSKSHKLYEICKEYLYK